MSQVSGTYDLSKNVDEMPGQLQVPPTLTPTKTPKQKSIYLLVPRFLGESDSLTVWGSSGIRFQEV